MSTLKSAAATAGWVMALACAWPAAPSTAAVVTQTASASRSSGLMSVSSVLGNPGYVFTPASAQTLDFGGFNGMLGTLNAVQIAYTYQFTYQVSTAAYNPVPGMTANYSLRQNLTAPGVGNVQSNCSNENCLPLPLLGRNALVVDVFTGTSPIFSKTVQVGLGSLQTYASRPVQISIADPGSGDYLAVSVSNPSFIADSLRIDTAVTATLSYTYTPAAPVPEPGTQALMAGGVALLALQALRTFTLR